MADPKPPNGDPPAGDAPPPAKDAPPPANDLEGLDNRARELLDRANSEAATRRRETRAAERRAEEAERKLAEVEKSAMSDTEKAVAEAREEGYRAAMAEVGTRELRAYVREAAAGKLRDPADAVRLLDLDALAEVKEDDRDAAIRDAIDHLIGSKPYLALDTNGARGPASLITQGARSGATPDPGAAASSPDEWIRRSARTR
jgi:hypothetical protein